MSEIAEDGSAGGHQLQLGAIRNVDNINLYLYSSHRFLALKYSHLAKTLVEPYVAFISGTAVSTLKTVQFSTLDPKSTF